MTVDQDDKIAAAFGVDTGGFQATPNLTQGAAMAQEFMTVEDPETPLILAVLETLDEDLTQ